MLTEYKPLLERKKADDPATSGGVGDCATSSPQQPDTGYRILTLKKAGYRIPDSGCRHFKKADTGCRIPDADT